MTEPPSPAEASRLAWQRIEAERDDVQAMLRDFADTLAHYARTLELYQQLAACDVVQQDQAAVTVRIPRPLWISVQKWARVQEVRPAPPDRVDH